MVTSDETSAEHTVDVLKRDLKYKILLAEKLGDLLRFLESPIAYNCDVYTVYSSENDNLYVKIESDCFLYHMKMIALMSEDLKEELDQPEGDYINKEDGKYVLEREFKL